MQKAEQAALVQEANQQIIAIRQAELDYFSNFYNNFGTQAALIAGFVVNALTGVEAEMFDTNVPMHYVFWISVVFAFGLSTNILLGTQFLSALGPGLALRGPEGSMVKAVEGMEMEQYKILRMYCYILAVFSVSMVGLFWTVMEQTAALISTLVFVLFGYAASHYCQRIYNRFKYQKVRDERGREITVDAAEFRDEDEDEVERELYLKSEAYLALEKEINLLALNYEGYLVKKGKRRYFVLQGSTLKYFYKKEDYLMNPNKAIKDRPINLFRYQLLAPTKDGTSSNAIILKPQIEGDNFRVWELVCEEGTEDAILWRKVMTKVFQGIDRLRSLEQSEAGSSGFIDIK